jgi:hypothetical protein
MAKKPAKRPQVILSPDVSDDDDVPVMGVPDEDGWVYLKRSAKQPPEKQRGKEAKPRASRKR